MAAVAELANDVGTSADCQALCMPRASARYCSQLCGRSMLNRLVVPRLDLTMRLCAMVRN
jgi:hypothetical protein